MNELKIKKNILDVFIIISAENKSYLKSLDLNWQVHRKWIISENAQKIVKNALESKCLNLLQFEDHSIWFPDHFQLGEI